MAHFTSAVERSGLRRARSATVDALALLSIVVLASCAPHDPKFVPGVSDGPLPVDSAASAAPVPSARWEHFDRVGRLEVLKPTFRSRGHGTGDWDAELRATAGAGEALDALVQGHQMPVGTLLHQRHQQRQVDAELGAFVMEKRAKGYFPEGGDWEYAVIGRDGRVEASGKLAPCARCHAEAPVDFVFPRR